MQGFQDETGDQQRQPAYLGPKCADSRLSAMRFTMGSRLAGMYFLGSLRFRA